MASLTELARDHTDLGPDHIDHLQRLLAAWGLLSDLCFSDLLLFAPVRRGASVAEPGEYERFVVLGQIRPSTSQTVYRGDLVGTLSGEDDRPLVARSFRIGEIIEGELLLPGQRERVRELCIPVRRLGEVLAVLTRESAPSVGRQPGELERTYVDIFHRFARMIVLGEFPFGEEDSTSQEPPRVGDGVILLDDGQRVEYTSPNAVSALHRMGVHRNVEGWRLGEVGLDDEVVREAFAASLPTARELERIPNVTLTMRTIPLLDHGKVTGAVVLLRDVSELRVRDRLLLSKDATIREIHHRVKNNLQTISSLLRLQGRRLASPEAKAAIEESVRRIGSIALVHETLSREAGDDVPFVEIVRPLVRLVEETLVAPERPVRFTVQGDAGTLPASLATPLAVVLNELLQNAVDHGYPPEWTEAGHVTVTVELVAGDLLVQVADDGVGLPPGFRPEASTGLGLSIVRTLVTTELHGTIDIRPGDGPDGHPGTVVEVRVPFSVDA